MVYISWTLTSLIVHLSSHLPSSIQHICVTLVFPFDYVCVCSFSPPPPPSSLVLLIFIFFSVFSLFEVCVRVRVCIYVYFVYVYAYVGICLRRFIFLLHFIASHWSRPLRQCNMRGPSNYYILCNFSISSTLLFVHFHLTEAHSSRDGKRSILLETLDDFFGGHQTKISFILPKLCAINWVRTHHNALLGSLQFTSTTMMTFLRDMFIHCSLNWGCMCVLSPYMSIKCVCLVHNTLP